MSRMSFKRDSIDTSLLRNLKFRRVSEILAHQIPEDEARLLSNGRLTCLVCLHRPIFDNVNILSIHRQGRRHIAELSKYLLHKRDLQMKLQKSNQLKELGSSCKNSGKISDDGNLKPREDLDPISSPNQNTHPLLSSVPYSSFSKKRSQKFPLTMKRKMALETPKMSPRSSALVMEDSEVSQLPSAHSEVRRYLKGLLRKKPLSKVVEKLKEGYGLPPAHQEISINAKKCVITKSSVVENITSSSHAVSVSDVRTLQHPSTLVMSGWIWKNDVDGGKWIKDPNAEFDSDEEDS